MKYRFRFLLLSLLLVLTSMGLRAQAQLGMYTKSTSSSTPTLGDQLYVYTVLKNYSLTDTFSNVINFSLANKDSIMVATSVVGLPPFANSVITIAPGDSMSALFTVQLLADHFSAGPDIIIVWPIVTTIGFHPVDSARAPIIIRSPLAVTDEVKERFNAFVYDDNLFVRNKNAQIPLEQVQIFDLTGAIVSTQKLNASDTTIPLGQLPQGCYIAVVSSTDGEKRMLKFVR